jgi:5-bromo-4-chloroindolyl phosphate hydrolysis protein
MFRKRYRGRVDWDDDDDDWDDDDGKHSRKRRRSRDVDRAFELVRNEVVEPMLDPYKRAQREVEREKRREIAKRQGERRLVATGAGLLVGGAASIGLPTVAAVGLGLMVGGVVMVLMRFILPAGEVSLKNRKVAFQTPVAQRPTLETPKIDTKALPTTRAELIQKVLGEATEDLKKLDAALPRLRDFSVVASVAKIVAVGQRVTQAVAIAPDKLPAAQRLFTFYCPKAVEVTSSLIEMQADPNIDAARMEATRDVLSKLEMVFDKTEIELKSVDGRVLDIELRVLNQSLDEDLRR